MLAIGVLLWLGSFYLAGLDDLAAPIVFRVS
jgi:hypothetical protein